MTDFSYSDRLVQVAVELLHASVLADKSATQYALAHQAYEDLYDLMSQFEIDQEPVREPCPSENGEKCRPENRGSSG
jgi:hypothetical protein